MLLLLSAPFLTALPLLAVAQEPADAPNSLGTVKPQITTSQSVIAVVQFGVDPSVGLQIDTMPRVIRRDLELTGFFKMPADQRAVNSLNMFDVAQSTVNFAEWEKLGVEHYLMGSISMPSPGVLDVRVILYDIASQKAVINRNIKGDAADPRMLAHRISDEVVRFTKFTDGFAQTQFLFVTEQVPGIREVGTVDSDGFNQRALTQYQSLCTTPIWGANGTEIYYTSYHGKQAHIYGQLLRTGQTWKIAGYGGTNHSPDWNASRGRLLMVLSKDGNSEIYSSSRDGQGLQRITQTATTEGSPCWSPDGSKILYVTNEAQGAHIYVANADGSGKRKLTNRGSWNDAPAWSPDGERIAFVSRNSGKNDIFIIDADGNGDSVRRLTMNQGNNESPTWAPNSRHLAFSSDRSGSWQIYLMLDDGSSQNQITTSGRNTQPDWGPAPVVKE
jgi:TolB protein